MRSSLTLALACVAAGLVGWPLPAFGELGLVVDGPDGGAASRLVDSASVVVSGVLSGDIEGARLLWRNDRQRGSHEAMPGPVSNRADGRVERRFTLEGLTLEPGRNVLRLEAFDANGVRTIRRLSFTRAEPAAAAPDAWLAVRGRVLPASRHGDALVVEGDIVARRDATSASPYAIGIGSPTAYWPKVAGVAQIPYVATNGNANVAPAISQYNAAFPGVIQWVARSTEVDYVDFDLDPNDHSGGGLSSVGRVGGRQVIGGSIDANVPTLLHEMGHATGLWHEQSRPDRDAHLQLIPANTIKTLEPNFDVVTDNVQSIGLYDLQSIMQYLPFTFTKNGQPTLETRPAGIRVSDLGTFSAGDVDAIDRLYGHAPTKVTITSNPPGLKVVVDGVTVTTPKAFTFALGSTHTLGVPAAPQALGGDAYTFGRWNDSTAASHTITVAPGNGLEASPAARPAVTVYQADFVQWLPYAPFVYPTGAGTLSASPAPQALPGQAGLWAIARQPLTLTATPAAGNALYRLYTADGPASQNPRVTRAPDWVLAYFTAHANTTVNTTPAGRWVWVDGSFWEGPVNWTVDYPADGDWSPGTTHHLDVSVSPQYPYSSTVRYPWQSWSDHGAFVHDVVVPVGNATYTAAFGTEFQVNDWAQPGCAGTVGVTPTSVDGFYAKGASVTFDESAIPAWVFSGWLDDASGTGHPKTLSMSDERLMVASFNTVVTPLTITSFSPDHAVVGQAGFTLMINGRGFTSATRVFVNGVYRAPIKATATQVKVKLTTADLKKVGSIQLDVDNVPAGTWPCSNYALRAFQVLANTAVPLAGVSPSSLTFAAQTVGSSSAPQGVTLANGGTALLALHEAALSGANASDFALTSTCGSGLAAAATCGWQVTFTPGGTGARTATLLVVDSAFDSPQVVTLTGTGM